MEGCTLGQVLHGSATTTEAIRRGIQRSQESLRALAKRHGINPKTVAKWRKRSFVADLPTGPKQPSSHRCAGLPEGSHPGEHLLVAVPGRRKTSAFQHTVERIDDGSDVKINRDSLDMCGI